MRNWSWDTIETMTLGEYVRQLMHGQSYRDVAAGAKAAGEHIARGTIHLIVSGETLKPNPETLKALARHFGKTEEESREIYRNLMDLAGYLEYLPLESEPAQPRRLTLKEALASTDDIAEQYDLDNPANQGHPLDKKQNSQP